MKPLTRIATYTAEHGGGTFDARTFEPVEPASGYAVGLAQGTAAYVWWPKDVDRFAKRVARMWNAPYVGTWHDPATGWVEVDPVVIVADYAEAMSLARLNGQKAIYSFATREAIPVRAKGECACGSRLTIADRGPRCRQCVLEGRRS
jgi:hypothetical protein